MTTPNELYGVKKDDWFDYEALRRSGRMNMFGARPYLGLSREEFGAILSHFAEMKEAWMDEFNALHPEEEATS